MKFFVHLQQAGSNYYPTHFTPDLSAEDFTQEAPEPLADIVTGSIEIEPLDAMVRYPLYQGTAENGAVDGSLACSYYLFLDDALKVVGMMQAHESGVFQETPELIEGSTSVVGSFPYTVAQRGQGDLTFDPATNGLIASA